MWPGGFTSGAAAGSIKPGGELDVGVVLAPRAVEWAGTFTRNAAAAAPVNWCRNLLGKEVRAVVVNGGNANACTGAAGTAATERTARTTAAVIGCDPEQVLVASTGPIGVPLPVERLVEALPDAVGAASNQPDAFARAIMTTDTLTKVSSAPVQEASIVGVAKGAAMLAPRMATMLAFITTDALVPDLQHALSAVVSRTFDRISVDACESTNDSVFLLASGATPVDRPTFESGLEQVCRDLAEQMVRDAEGGSRLVRIQVAGAGTDEESASLGRAIAASALWRAAVNGADPNWGRVIAALGSACPTLELSDMTIGLGSETVFDRGEPVGSPQAAAKAMDGDEFVLSCVVGGGPGEAEILSTDLSQAYVALNAGGTT